MQLVKLLYYNPSIFILKWIMISAIKSLNILNNVYKIFKGGDRLGAPGLVRTLDTRSRFEHTFRVKR